MFDLKLRGEFLGAHMPGKSHIMAVMHHAIQSPDIVEEWLHGWGDKLDDSEIKNFKMIECRTPTTQGTAGTYTWQGTT